MTLPVVIAEALQCFPKLPIEPGELWIRADRGLGLRQLFDIILINSRVFSSIRHVHD